MPRGSMRTPPGRTGRADDDRNANVPVVSPVFGGTAKAVIAALLVGVAVVIVWRASSGRQRPPLTRGQVWPRRRPIAQRGARGAEGASAGDRAGRERPAHAALALRRGEGDAGAGGGITANFRR